MKILLVIISLIPVCFGFAQHNININDLRLSFESFEYSDVIVKADNLLKGKDTINTADLLEILQMKAISHYALADEPNVRKSFIEMLQQDRNYELDSEKVSPKIIKLFSEVKTVYIQSVPEKNSNTVSEPLIKSPDYRELSLRYMEEKESITRSFIFPGWGHLYTGKTLKGSILSSAAVINTGALIYFIFDTNKKHSAYLNERDPVLLKEKYSSYNSSYKVRNILIGSLIAVYAYTQVDILFFNNSILPQISMHDNGLQLSLEVNF